MLEEEEIITLVTANGVTNSISTLQDYASKQQKIAEFLYIRESDQVKASEYAIDLLDTLHRQFDTLVDAIKKLEGKLEKKDQKIAELEDNLALQYKLPYPVNNQRKKHEFERAALCS